MISRYYSSSILVASLAIPIGIDCGILKQDGVLLEQFSHQNHEMY